MDEARLEEAKDLAAKHLGRRMRSEREIEIYLDRKGFSREIIARAVADFRRVGLLDDRALVRDWTERRLASHPSGRLAIERTLRARGVSEETLVQVLDEMYGAVSEDDLSRRAAARYLQRLGNLPPETRRRRLCRFLEQRGFSRETIREFFEQTDV